MDTCMLLTMVSTSLSMNPLASAGSSETNKHYKTLVRKRKAAGVRSLNYLYLRGRCRGQFCSLVQAIMALCVPQC